MIRIGIYNGDSMEFIEYSKCSTCKKAKNFLDENNIEYVDREIKDRCPTYDEINTWINKFGIDLNKLFNTSGLIYRNMNLKDKLKDMNKKEKIDLLSNNPMLIKRPILVCRNKVLVGFKIDEWESII